MQVEDIVAKASRADNGWRSSNEIVPSAVAGFMSIWALDIRDRHQGNMGAPQELFCVLLLEHLTHALVVSQW